MNYRITTSQHAGLVHTCLRADVSYFLCCTRNNKGNRRRLHAGNVHTYPDIFENRDFFLRFSLVSACQRRFRAPETQVFENGPQRGVFLKTTADHFHADGRKRKLSNLTMMSYIIERMPCKGYHHISVVLGFSCGQTEAIRI